MVDILGPADAIGAVTVRPADERTWGALDTFFKDCTTPTAEDGTDIRASWLNGITAALRALWRMNGKLADNVTPVVAENGNVDTGLANAVLHAIQRGQPLYSADTGAVNAMVATLTPVPLEYKIGMRFVVAAAFACTGPATCGANGLGVLAVTDANGSPLIRGAYQAGNRLEMIYDGAKLRIIAGAVSAPDSSSGLAVGNGATQTLVNAVYSVLNLGAASSALGTFAGNTFTCARAGLYSVGVSIGTEIDFTAAANASINTTIYKNGSAIPGVTRIIGIYTPGAGNGNYNHGASATVALKVGDTLSAAEMVQGSSISYMAVLGITTEITPLT